MKHYSNDARATLYQLFLDTHDGLESRYASNCGKGFVYRDKEYNTVSAVFDALSYEEIRYNCGVWTGIETGAITYEALVEFAGEFAIAIPAAAEYTALLNEDTDAANDMYQDACQKVLRAVTDGLIDTWHSSCIIRSKRSKVQK